MPHGPPSPSPSPLPLQVLIPHFPLQCLCITVGANPENKVIGFQYWNNPGPFVQFLGIEGSLGRFLGFWRVMGSAAYAFSNVENISVPAAETENPRYNIPKAARRVFWRVMIFYVITMFFIGITVASNNKALTAHSGDAGASPFAIAANSVGIVAVPSIINAVVVTSAWSAGNSGSYRPIPPAFSFADVETRLTLPVYHSYARRNSYPLRSRPGGPRAQVFSKDQPLRRALLGRLSHRVPHAAGVHDAVQLSLRRL